MGLDEYGDLWSFRVREAVTDLLTEALRAAASKTAVRNTAASLLVILLISMLRNTFGIAGMKLNVLSLAGASAIALFTVGGNNALCSLSVETLHRSQELANVLLPVMSGSALLSGAVSAAAAKHAAAAFFLNVLTNLCVNGVAPVVQLYASAAVAEAATDNELISSVMGFLKWGVTTALTVLMLAFTLYLSLCGLIRGTADAAAIRSAKTTISTVLPVVGSIASDAASAVLAAAGTVRQAVGVFGLTAVLAVLLLPFLRVGLQYLLFKGAAAVSAGLADAKLRKLMVRLSESLAMLLACLGACGLMLFFSLYSLMEVTIR